MNKMNTYTLQPSSPVARGAKGQLQCSKPPKMYNRFYLKKTFERKYHQQKIKCF